MPNRCVVGKCHSTPNPGEGIFVYTIPFFGVDRPEEKKRRKKWVDFVNVKRKDFTPTKGSCICSKHFKQEDFTKRFALLPGLEKPNILRLLRDDVGYCVYPSIHVEEVHVEKPQSERSKRRVRKKH